MSTDPKNWASEFARYSQFQRWQAGGAALDVEVELDDVNTLFSRLVTAGVLMHEEFLRFVFEAERRIIMRTPVRTGRAKNSWHTVKGNEPDAFQYTDNEGNAFDGALGLPAGDPWEAVVGSNVVYMIALEAGHSRQAPNGMVAITLAEIEGGLDRRLDQILIEHAGTDV